MSQFLVLGTWYVQPDNQKEPAHSLGCVDGVVLLALAHLSLMASISVVLGMSLYFSCTNPNADKSTVEPPQNSGQTERHQLFPLGINLPKQYWYLQNKSSARSVSNLSGTQSDICMLICCLHEVLA